MAPELGGKRLFTHLTAFIIALSCYMRQTELQLMMTLTISFALHSLATIRKIYMKNNSILSRPETASAR